MFLRFTFSRGGGVWLLLSFQLAMLASRRVATAWLSTCRRHSLSRTVTLQSNPAFPPTQLISTTHNNYSNPTTSRLLYSTRNDDDDDDDDNENTKWKVPKGLYIPEGQLDMNFVRSSGAGGQNVNKVNSQVQIKLKLDDSCHWIPAEVRQRLRQQQANRINKEQELVLHVQEHRTQMQNKKAALDKLQSLILQAWARPKVRKIKKGMSKETKERFLEQKRRTKMKKESRRRVDF